MKPTARRNFLRSSGAAVSAAMLPAAAAAAASGSQTPDADVLALRTLYRDYAAKLPSPILHDPSHPADAIEIAPGGLTARARFHCLIHVTEPLTGSGTIVEMARLQGNVASARWEPGTHELAFSKTAAGWSIDQARFLKSYEGGQR